MMGVAFYACEKKQAHEVISPKSPFGSFYMHVDTVSIPITEQQTFIYPLFGTVAENDALYLLGYNRFTYSIDIFDLSCESYEGKIALEEQGPNGIPEVISFAPVTLDSIYIMSAHQIVLINRKGEVKDKIAINTTASPIKGHDSDEAYFWMEKNHPIHFSKKHRKLFGLYHSMQYGACDPRRYKGNKLISAIDVKAGSMSYLPVSYPPEMQENCYGFMSTLFTTWDHDSLLYNFKNDPNIYLYDLTRGETSIFDGRSQYTKNKVQPISWDRCEDVGEKLNHHMRSVNFERIIRDPYRKLYYRFHRKELPATSNPSDYIFSDKTLFMSIFDNGMAKTGEMILDSRPYPSHVSFPTDRGLYVAAPSGENTLNFHVFKVFLIKEPDNEQSTTID